MLRFSPRHCSPLAGAACREAPTENCPQATAGSAKPGPGGPRRDGRRREAQPSWPRAKRASWS